MSIAIEAAELMERFQWLKTEEAQAAVEDADERAAVADELTDRHFDRLAEIQRIDPQDFRRERNDGSQA
jgi:hypothetical protein